MPKERAAHPGSKLIKVVYNGTAYLVEERDYVSELLATLRVRTQATAPEPLLVPNTSVCERDTGRFLEQKE